MAATQLRFLNLPVYDGSAPSSLSEIFDFHRKYCTSDSPIDCLLAYASFVLIEMDDKHYKMFPTSTVAGSTFEACYQISEMIHYDSPGANSCYQMLASVSNATRHPDAKNKSQFVILKISSGAASIGYLCIAESETNSLFHLVDNEFDTIFFSYIEDRCRRWCQRPPVRRWVLRETHLV
jgi:hypothetical protein